MSRQPIQRAPLRQILHESNSHEGQRPDAGCHGGIGVDDVFLCEKFEQAFATPLLNSDSDDSAGDNTEGCSLGGEPFHSRVSNMNCLIAVLVLDLSICYRKRLSVVTTVATLKMGVRVHSACPTT